MSRRTLPAALVLLPCLLLPPVGLGAQAFLVEDIETEGVPLPDPNCPFEPDACPPVFGSLPEQLTPFGDLLAFTAFESESGRELWVSDGSAAGTRMVADLRPGEAGSRPDLLGVSENGLVFCARTEPDPADPSCQLFVTDGTDTAPLGVSDAWTPAAVRDGVVYFQRFDEEIGGHVLWRTDGTPGGTEAVYDLCPFPEDHPDRDDCNARLVDLVSHAGSLYLVTSYTDLGHPERRTMQRLDRQAGLPVGHGLPQEFETEAVHQDSAIYEVTPFRAGVLLVGYRPHFPVSVPYLLAFFDGQDFVGLGGFHDLPFSLTTSGALAYFQTAVDATDSPPSTSVGRIWRTDGTLGGTEVHLPDVSGWSPTGAEDRLFFIFDERTHPPGNLWLAVTGEEGEVTRLVRSAPSLLSAPTAIGPRVFLPVHSSDGIEPWISDGTRERTQALGDVAQGAAGSDPEAFTPVEDLVFFTATNEELGRELWAVRLSELPDLVPPEPPFDGWIDSPLYPDFRFQVRITPSAGSSFEGREEGDCQPDTVCVSGALPGRSEAFLRVLGPRPNGFHWPTVTRFTPSRLEVWIEQVSSGTRRYYRLEAVPPGTDDLPGLQDRRGFPAG